MDGWVVATAISAAEQGGEILRRWFGELAPGDVSEKEKNDWVSAADRASEGRIVAYLRERTPAFAMLAEETGESGGSGPKWVLDPLDGTLNFVRGFPHFAVSLALVDGGRERLGVIVDPMRGETFVAVEGRGATCNGRPIRVSGRSALEGAFVTTGFPYRIAPRIDLYLQMLREVFTSVAAVRRPGAAALDLAHTASGVFDGFFELSLSPWDIAAGVVLVREAGGVVTDFAGLATGVDGGSLVAGTPGVHAGLLEIVARCSREAASRG